MEEQIVETWRIHNRIHLYLLEALEEATLNAVLPPKSRNVFELFAHIHNVRLMWLKSAAQELTAGVEKLEPKPVGTKDQIATALEASGTAIETMLRQSLVAGGKIKGFKPHAAAFLGYLIAHESHHRGQIEWVLKYSGHPLPDKVSYGLWEWGVR